jgi:hypothetical protein
MFYSKSGNSIEPLRGDPDDPAKPKLMTFEEYLAYDDGTRFILNSGFCISD